MKEFDIVDAITIVMILMPVIVASLFARLYVKEKEEADVAQLYGRNRQEKRANVGVELVGGTTYMAGDYPNPVAKPMVRPRWSPVTTGPRTSKE